MRPIPPTGMMGPMSRDPNRRGGWTKGIVAMVPNIMVPDPHPGARKPVIAGAGQKWHRFYHRHWRRNPNVHTGLG